MLTKIVSKFWKTLESYKTQENAFYKTRERLFLENYQLVFCQCSGNLKINGKLWENDLD